jgi:hypothetical protein
VGICGGTTPVSVNFGARVLIRNSMSMMFHPMQVQGCTFTVTGSGVRKDIVIVRPTQTLGVARIP